MSAFATLSSPLFFHNPFHGKVCKQRLPGRFPHTTMLTAPLMRTPGDGEAPEFEDDDAEMGDSQGSHGIRLPYFTKEDQDYLNAASSSEEYVARMTDLAKKKERDRKIANAKSGAQTPDDYVESLKRKPVDLSDQPYDSKGTSTATDYVESLNVRQPPDLSGGPYDSTGINAGEAYIRQLNSMRERNATSDLGPATGDLEPAAGDLQDVSTRHSPDSSTRSVQQVQEFQAFLRQSAGVSEGDLSPENSVDISRIDEDIHELEARLRKVVLEENPDGSTAAATAGDMEALDEKFQEIRSQMSGFDEETKSSNQISGNEPAENVDVVDRQIGFLESYLEKLKREQEVEGDETSTLSRSDSGDNMSDDKSQQGSGNRSAVGVEESEPVQEAGLQDGSKERHQKELNDKFTDAMQMLSDKVNQQPGGSKGKKEKTDVLSEEEKMEAFDAIRREIMKQRGQMNSQYADPLAVPLPEKKSDVARDEEEDDDVDLSSARIPDGYFVISEVEAEIKRYLFDARSMLDDHESRMKSLMQKLKDLE